MAQAVGELGEIALEIGEIEHRGRMAASSDRISASQSARRP
jgi:hypothetical protein